MKRVLRLSTILISILLFSIGNAAFAQKNYEDSVRKEVKAPIMPTYDPSQTTFSIGEYDSTYWNSKRKDKQQKSYQNREYYFPAKPRNQWELGINFGLANVSGDVKPIPLGGFGAGISIRKALGYSFSLRGTANYYTMKGLNWEPSSGIQFNPALNGYYDPKVDYNDPVLNPSGVVFHNYQTKIIDASLQALITLGNIKFHRERTIFILYGMVGAGAQVYTTKYNALDASGAMYDYNIALAANTDGGPYTKEDKKPTLDALHGILDDTYETAAEGHLDEETIGDGVLNPVLKGGLGLGFRISKRFSLGLEWITTWTNDDLIDGQRWQETNVLTRTFDSYNYEAISLNINLATKKATEPLWWTNPVDYTYRKLAEMDPQRIVDIITKDTDKDGVIDLLDQEPKTKPDCQVDTKGRSLDSDKDGVLDCDDLEPFTQPFCMEDGVDAQGRGNCPCPDDCGGGMNCEEIELPSVHFDLDKYYIKPEYYATLHIIAERLRFCPDLKVVVTGYADYRSDAKYNEQLSWNRVNKTIEYLTSKYGIERSRFIFIYKGEVEGGKTEFEKYLNRRVDFRFAKDGENGDSNPAPPHPGIDAGEDK